MRKTLSALGIIFGIAILAQVAGVSLAAPFPSGLGGLGTIVTPASGTIPIGNGAGSYTPAALTPGTNVIITNASGSVTIAVNGTAFLPSSTVYVASVNGQSGAVTITSSTLGVATNTISLFNGNGFATTTIQAVLNALSATGLASYSSSTGVFSVSSSSLNLKSASQYNFSDFLPSSTVYVASVNGQSGAVTVAIPATTTINGTQASVFKIIGDGTTATSSVNGSTTTFSIINTGNWAGTWQGVNSSTFYLATNPNGYISFAPATTTINGTKAASFQIIGTGLLTSTVSGATTTFSLATTSISQFVNDKGYITAASASTTINGTVGNTFTFNTSSTGNALTITTSSNGIVNFLLQLSAVLTSALQSLNGATSSAQTVVGGTGISVSTAAGTANSTTTVTNIGVSSFNGATGTVSYAPSTTIPTSYVSSFNSQTGAATYAVNVGAGLTVTTSTTSSTVTLSLNNGLVQNCTNQGVSGITATGTIICSADVFSIAGVSTGTVSIVAGTNITISTTTNSITINSTGGGASGVSQLNSATGSITIIGAGSTTVSTFGGTITISSPTSTAAAGSNTQLQFNNGGSLGANIALTFNPSSDVLTAPTGTFTTAYVMDFDTVLYADQFPGSDIGAQDNNAYAACPSTGCEVKNPSGILVYTTPIVWGTNYKVATLYCPSGGGASNNATGGTVMDYTPSTGSAFTVNTNNYVVGGSGITNCDFEGSNGTSARTSVGIYEGGASGAVVSAATSTNLITYTFAAGAVLANAQDVTFTGSSLPGGVASNTTYYVGNVTGNTFELYTNASLATPVTITSNGTGSFSDTHGAFGFTLTNVNVSGFGIGQYEGQSTSFWTDINVALHFNGFNLWIASVAGANGENGKYIGGVIADSNNQVGATENGCITNQLSGNTQISFIGPSIDDCQYYADQSGGTANISNFYGVHWENPNGQNYIYILTLSNVPATEINLYGGDMMNDDTSCLSEYVSDGGDIYFDGVVIDSNSNVSCATPELVLLDNTNNNATVAWFGLKDNGKPTTYVVSSTPFSTQGYASGIGTTYYMGYSTSTNIIGTTTYYGPFQIASNDLIDSNGNKYVTSTASGVSSFNGATGAITYAPSSTLASSSLAFEFFNATATAPAFQSIQTPNQKNITSVSCFEYAAATTTIELFYNTTLASSSIQQVILSSLACGISGTSVTSFTTSTLPANSFLFATVNSTAGTPQLTTINVIATKQ